MSQATILVVEDEILVALMLTESLRSLGYNVIGPALDGDEAVFLASQAPPDVVLMDIRLKGSSDGIDAARALQARHDCRIIFASGQADRATMERATEVGPVALLRKPFSPEQVAAAVRRALDGGQG